MTAQQKKAAYLDAYFRSKAAQGQRNRKRDRDTFWQLQALRMKGKQNARRG